MSNSFYKRQLCITNSDVITNYTFFNIPHLMKVTPLKKNIGTVSKYLRLTTYFSNEQSLLSNDPRRHRT